MEHDTQRGVDRERDTLDQAVRYLQRMNREWSDLKTFSRPNFAQIGIVEELMFIELILDVSQREFGAPDGNIQFAENPGQGANVVFMAMSKDCLLYTSRCV